MPRVRSTRTHSSASTGSLVGGPSQSSTPPLPACTPRTTARVRTRGGRPFRARRSSAAAAATRALIAFSTATRCSQTRHVPSPAAAANNSTRRSRSRYTARSATASASLCRRPPAAQIAWAPSAARGARRFAADADGHTTRRLRAPRAVASVRSDGATPPLAPLRYGCIARCAERRRRSDVVARRAWRTSVLCCARRA